MNKKRVPKELREALEAYSRLGVQYEAFLNIIANAAGDLPGVLALHGYAVPRSIAKLDSTGYWTAEAIALRNEAEKKEMRAWRAARRHKAASRKVRSE
jgi:hypothetical protein